MQVYNSFQDIQETAQSPGIMSSFNAGTSVLDKYAPYMEVPGVRESVERMQELEKQFKDNVKVARSLGGDAKSDNPFLN